MNQVTLTLWGPNWIRGRVLCVSLSHWRIGWDLRSVHISGEPLQLRSPLAIDQWEREIGGHGGPITWCTRCSVDYSSTARLLVPTCKITQAPRGRTCTPRWTQLERTFNTENTSGDERRKRGLAVKANKSLMNRWKYENIWRWRRTGCTGKLTLIEMMSRQRILCIAWQSNIRKWLLWISNFYYVPWKEIDQSKLTDLRRYPTLIQESKHMQHQEEDNGTIKPK